jgi:hypothetical protein
MKRTQRCTAGYIFFREGKVASNRMIKGTVSKE